jgi:hypothetical protein
VALRCPFIHGGGFVAEIVQDCASFRGFVILAEIICYLQRISSAKNLAGIARDLFSYSTSVIM